MERIVRQTMLYDFYGELLTEQQKKAYEAVVMDDLSYAELARLSNISRQGAYDMIHRCDKQLEAYEERLHLVERFIRIKDELREIEASAKELKTEMISEADQRIKQRIEQEDRISGNRVADQLQNILNRCESILKDL